MRETISKLGVGIKLQFGMWAFHINCFTNACPNYFIYLKSQETKLPSISSSPNASNSQTWANLKVRSPESSLGLPYECQGTNVGEPTPAASWGALYQEVGKQNRTHTQSQTLHIGGRYSR